MNEYDTEEPIETNEYFDTEEKKWKVEILDDWNFFDLIDRIETYEKQEQEENERLGI